MNDQSRTAANIFGPVLYTYSRSQAVADGLQVEVSKVAEEAGIRFPVFLNRAVYDNFVSVPPGVTGQDEAGRLWDVWMLRFAIRKAQPGQARLPFALYVRHDNKAPRLIKLVAMCGALDIDDPQPTITILTKIEPARGRAGRPQPATPQPSIDNACRKVCLYRLPHAEPRGDHCAPHRPGLENPDCGSHPNRCPSDGSAY
jgi:hypothetical protein